MVTALGATRAELGAPAGGSARPRTLDEATRALCDWLKPFLRESEIALRKATSGAATGACLTLESAVPLGRPPSSRLSVVSLSYRLLLDLDDPLREQRLLGEILFAVADGADYASAEGLRQESSGASIVLSTRLVRPLETPVTPLVRVTPKPRIEGLQRLDGIVLGPGDRPLPDVAVSLGESGPTQRTDAAGRFAFPALPSDRASWRLIVEAKGQRFTVDAAAAEVCVARIPLRT